MPNQTFETSKFFKETTFEERRDEAQRILDKYPDRCPLIIDSTKFTLDKKKFLFPAEITWQQSLFIIRKRLSLKPEQSMYLYVDNILPPSSKTIGESYAESKSDCGFLYVFINPENTFG